MKRNRIKGKLAITLAGTAALCTCAPDVHAELATGPEAREYFELQREAVGDHYIDFESGAFSNGPLTTHMIGTLEITFKTTQVRYPGVVNVDYPVVLIPYGYVGSSRNETRTLMGSGSAGGSPDGQARYEIRFSEPQGRVGMMRMWNTNALTRFYNPDGVLLAEHQNTEASEFVGWMAEGPELSRWVSRVEIDGVNAGGAYQVGETDELFFGTEKPVEPIEPIYGPEALARFIHIQEVLGDTLIDFNDLPSGPLSTIELPDGAGTLVFRTTEKRYPRPPVAVDLPVAVSSLSAPSGTKEIMGASNVSGSRDGQHQYEIVFPAPQHRAGIKRNWNTHSLTRFYNRDGFLLAEHQNTQNHEFVGWIGDPGEEASWVAKIVIDGLDAGGAYQVGYSDDLRFGSNLPPRERPRFTSIVLTPEDTLTILWQPEIFGHSCQYSHDMVNWQTADGTLTTESWTGTVPGDGPVFFRFLAVDFFGR